MDEIIIYYYFSIFSSLSTAAAGITVAHHGKLLPAATSQPYLYLSSVKGGLCRNWYARGVVVLDILVCLECREENIPFSGQLHQAQRGLNRVTNLQ